MKRIRLRTALASLRIILEKSAVFALSPLCRELKVPVGMKSSPPESAPPTGTGLFRQFQAAFEKITGLPVDVLAPGEFRIPERAPDFCLMMGLTARTCEACHDVHSRLQDTADLQTRTEKCFAGLTSTSVPVRRNGQVVAYLHTGHVFLNGDSEAAWDRLRRYLAAQGLDPDACQAALNAAKCADPTQYQSAVHLLEIFAQQLAEVMPAPPGQSYPAVEKALQIIQRDLEQDWTLAKVAARVKMNASYFSDMFHKSTGETFTACLARMRTERACRLLDSTRLGISEIAFASGFRSISQFNRTFKKCLRLSPRDYRSARSCAKNEKPHTPPRAKSRLPAAMA